MLNPRQRPILLAAAALLVIWVVAIAGYQIARHAKVTPEKVRAYTESVDFGQFVRRRTRGGHPEIRRHAQRADP